MSVEADLDSHLMTNTALTAIVGTKIYPLVASQSAAAPYIVHLKISEVREYSHQGFSDLSKIRIQISCYAPTYAQAKTLAEMVTATIESWPDENSNVQAAFHDGEELIYEEETKLFHIPIDFLIWYAS